MRAIAADAAGEVDAAKQAVVFQRYCHVYVSGELTALAATLNQTAHRPWIQVEEEYYDTGNWCLALRKLADPPPGLFELS